jgi:hypothetical protein
MKGIVAPIDRIAGWLLLIGALLHGYGSYLAYPSLSSTLVWALSGSVAALLLAGINLLRPERSAACLDLFGRLPTLDWHRLRLCCDPAKSDRPTTGLSPHCQSGVGGV